MEVEVERLNGLLLRRLATPNESPGAAAVGGSNGNGQPMTGKIESSGGDEPGINASVLIVHGIPKQSAHWPLATQVG